jgi:hypothetical protein
LGQVYRIITNTQNGDIITLNGDLHASHFNSEIQSKGKLYYPRELNLHGEMKLIIIQNPETYYNHDAHEYDWKLEIKGEDIEVEGSSYPLWIFGLILSTLPISIIIYYQINKKDP